MGFGNSYISELCGNKCMSAFLWKSGLFRGTGPHRDIASLNTHPKLPSHPKLPFLGFPELPCALLGFPVLLWAILIPRGLLWARMGGRGLSWAPLGSLCSSRLPWAPMGSPGLPCDLLGSLGSSGLSCAILGWKWLSRIRKSVCECTFL